MGDGTRRGEKNRKRKEVNPLTREGGQKKKWADGIARFAQLEVGRGANEKKRRVFGVAGKNSRHTFFS